MKKTNKVEGLTLCDFKPYYKATVMKTVWEGYKDRHIDQQNRTDGPEVKPCISDEMIFDKGANTVKWEKASLSTSGVGKTGYLPGKEWSWILTLCHIWKLTKNGPKI